MRPLFLTNITISDSWINISLYIAPDGSPLFMTDGFLDGRFQKKFLTDS